MRVVLNKVAWRVKTEELPVQLEGSAPCDPSSLPSARYFRSQCRPSAMSSTGGSVTSPVLQTAEKCFSCKVVCGIGLMATGGYVYSGARNQLRGGAVRFGTTVQIVLALGLISMGITVLVKLHSPQSRK